MSEGEGSFINKGIFGLEDNGRAQSFKGKREVLK
jgi:hypothetical protein